MGKIRIIGGRWRSRVLLFPDRAPLRPTPNRVREMVFNWLAPHLSGRTCLDAFAGSGALGFEALSRGAQQVVMLERHRRTAQQLQANAKFLNTENVVIINGAFPEAVPTPMRFDIVFMDPPFQDHNIARYFEALVEHARLAPGALMYWETTTDSTPPSLPDSWKILKQKTTGTVCAYLIQEG